MLDARLRQVADFVRQGSRLADIGTDHALLPTMLVSEGRCPLAIASDIKVGPVAAATRTVETANLTDTVSVRLGDGLSTVSPEETDDIVIAGMGGETIAAILEAAPWTKNERYRLILQPMTRAEKLRRYLYENGFSIESEAVVRDGRHWYTVLCVSFSGTPFVPTDAECYIGKVPMPQGDGYLQTVVNRLTKQQKGEQSAHLESVLDAIRSYRGK